MIRFSNFNQTYFKIQVPKHTQAVTCLIFMSYKTRPTCLQGNVQEYSKSVLFQIYNKFFQFHFMGHSDLLTPEKLSHLIHLEDRQDYIEGRGQHGNLF